MGILWVIALSMFDLEALRKPSEVVLGGLGICCSLDPPAHLCLQKEKT